MNSTDTRRFGGIARLYGNAALAAFENAHVCVMGVGGVGSWCAEALARSAVGRITLIDPDTVAESNINRQLPALTSTVGRSKAAVLAERFAGINPQCRITALKSAVGPDNFDALIPDDAVLVDAIDSLAAKTALAAWAKTHGRVLFISGGAGGRTGAARIRTGDLAGVTNDALLARVRTGLRKNHGFPAGSRDPKKTARFGLTAVFCDEAARGCAPDAALDVGHASGFGTAVVVTAAMGLRLAECVLAHLAAAAASTAV